MLFAPLCSDYDTHPDSTIWIPSAAPYHPIPAILIPYRDADTLLVFAHGNGCDIGSMYNTIHYYKNHWRVNVLLFEFPGYGACIGTPSEESINSNMRHVYEFIRDVLKWPNDRIILFGQSIGTGPVCELASTLNRSGVHLGGVILLSPYTCLKDVVQFLVGSVASRLIRTSFNNRACVKAIVDPILIIHGVQDEIIPIEHSNTLFDECASERKHLLVVNRATHNEFDHHHDIIAPISHFILCYIRTPARQHINASAAAAAAELAAASTSSSSAPVADADASSSSSSSSTRASSATTTTETPPPPPALTFFVHHPPSSPMPPSTIRIDRKYFVVPPEVVAAYDKRAEEARRAAESRTRTMERKAAVKEFFSGIGQRLASVSSAMRSSRRSTQTDAAESTPPDDMTQMPSGALRIELTPAETTAATTNARRNNTSISSSPSSTPSASPSAARSASSSVSRADVDSTLAPSPQRSHSPAGHDDSRSRSRATDDDLSSQLARSLSSSPRAASLKLIASEVDELGTDIESSPVEEEEEENAPFDEVAIAAIAQARQEASDRRRREHADSLDSLPETAAPQPEVDT